LSIDRQAVAPKHIRQTGLLMNFTDQSQKIDNAQPGMVAGIGIRSSRGDIDDSALRIPGLISHTAYRRIDV